MATRFVRSADHFRFLTLSFFASGMVTLPVSAADESIPRVPRFSIEYMDSSVSPDRDFFRYACGSWVKNNPVPADKSRWAAFEEGRERNWHLLHDILESSLVANGPATTPAGEVGDFFASAMDTNRIEQLGFKPLERDFARITALKAPDEVLALMAEFHRRDIGGMFAASVSPDAKNSSIYAFHLGQGGLGLPDRDYYLSPSFAKQREAYVAHVTKMLAMIGEKEAEAEAHAKTILELETELAKASKTRTELRDPIANYHKFKVTAALSSYRSLPLKTYLAASGLENMPDMIVRQPEFFAALEKLVKERSMDDWKAYLRWHVLRSTAAYLH